MRHCPFSNFHKRKKFGVCVYVDIKQIELVVSKELGVRNCG